MRWCNTLEANKSTFGVPNFRPRLRKTCPQRTHLNESTLRHDYKSTTNFLSELGRYTTVIESSSEIDISQIVLDWIVIFWFLIPSIFIKYVKLTMLSICRWIEVRSWLLRNVWRSKVTACSSNSLICYFLFRNVYVPPIDLSTIEAPVSSCCCSKFYFSDRTSFLSRPEFAEMLKETTFQLCWKERLHCFCKMS